MAQVTSRRRGCWLASWGVLASLLVWSGNDVKANDAVLDAQARAAASAGRIGEGIALMNRHLAVHPDDRVARLDLVRFLAWRGDYAAAIEALDLLSDNDADDVRALRARINAWAGRRETALALNEPLYTATPAEYGTAYTQALAARLGEWPQASLPALASVVAAKPDGDDTRDLIRTVRLPLFSSVGAPLSVYEDSDDIRIRSLGVDGNLRLNDTWRLLLHVVEREHSAPESGAFSPVTGGRWVDENRVGLGAYFAVSPDLAVEGMLGRSSLNPGDAEMIGHAQWSHRLSDAFQYALRAERDRMTASPRSVSLGVMRDGVSLSTVWRPTLRDNLRARVAFDDLNDGNRRHGIDVDYRHAVYRTERINVDVGGQLDWFGYSHDPGNGYYSPDRYMRVSPLAAVYIKLGEDVGLYLQGAVGTQGDETFGRWKRSADISGELTVGIFSHWQLVARAGYSERLRELGKYEGRSVGLELRYRFCEFRSDRCPQTTR